MSGICFFPIQWFEHPDWKSIQVIGQLENQQFVYINIPFEPYFTVKYDPIVDNEQIQQENLYLMDKTQVINILKIHEKDRLYRIYVTNKEDYHKIINFYQHNGQGTILDENQEIKSKFFSEKKIHPGSWQQAINLQTLPFNISSKNNFTHYELEFQTSFIISIDYDVPLPQENILFYSIQTKSNDQSIISISTIELTLLGIQNKIYLLHDKHIFEKDTIYSECTNKLYPINIIPADNETNLLQHFFNNLAHFHPNRLISLNSNINSLIFRSQKLRVNIPNFSPILNFEIAATSENKNLKLDLSGMSQIVLSKFYQKYRPHDDKYNIDISNHIISSKLYSSQNKINNTNNISEIYTHTMHQTIILYELWITDQINQKLKFLANLWKNNSEYVVDNDLKNLFDDLIHYIDPNVPKQEYHPGKPILIEKKSGIFRNIYLYSLSQLYLLLIEKLGTPLAKFISNYFKDTNNGITAFNSGYFNVTYDQIHEYILTKISEPIIWIDDQYIALSGKETPIWNTQTQDFIQVLSLVDYIPLIIISNQNWIFSMSSGKIYKKGTSWLIYPPFKLINKYIDYCVHYLMYNPQNKLIFPNLESSFDDFILQTKITSDDFINVPLDKSQIVHQLQELNLKPLPHWNFIRYIKTIHGDVIENIYLSNIDKYISLIDQDYYNKILQTTLNYFL